MKTVVDDCSFEIFFIAIVIVITNYDFNYFKIFETLITHYGFSDMARRGSSFGNILKHVLF